MAEMHDTTEEYLETILQLEEEQVVPIRARLSERLGVSAASVSETVQRLVERGLVNLRPDRSLGLTTDGRTLAVSVVRRHRLAERLLVDVIGLEWEKVHREAARWEHAISADVEEKLVELLGDPGTCPHGNPIPGSARRPSRSNAICMAQAGLGTISVTRISEALELNDDALVVLSQSRLIPGCVATVIANENSQVTLQTSAGTTTLPPEITRHLWVSPA